MEMKVPSGAGTTQVLVSAWAAWVVLARTVRAGHSYHLGRMLGENASASWWKTTGWVGMIEGWGGFLGIFDFFAHICREPWCSRSLCRAPADYYFSVTNL